MADPTVVEPRGEPGIPQYLNLSRLSAHQLPPHPDLPDLHEDSRISLGQFLNNLIAEIGRVHLEENSISHGSWSPGPIDRDVEMPPPFVRTTTGIHSLDATQSSQMETVKVPTAVHQWVKSMHNLSWSGRSSRHLGTHIRYEELDQLLAQDHGHQEARYTPNIYDTNELLAWSSQDLENAVAELTCKNSVKSVQMSIFQMFHKMPQVAGLNLLNDRVFHVLIMTAHSTYMPGSSCGTTERRQFVTVQLPINIDSFSSATSVMQKSRMLKKGDSNYYSPGSAISRRRPVTSEQMKRKGRKLVEGNYVSLENVFEARRDWYTAQPGTKPPVYTDADSCHHWRMMTLSTAGGVTRFAPSRTQMKETLNAISADVHEALKCIRKDRYAALGQRPPVMPRPWSYKRDGNPYGC